MFLKNWATKCLFYFPIAYRYLIFIKIWDFYKLLKLYVILNKGESVGIELSSYYRYSIRNIISEISEIRNKNIMH